MVTTQAERDARKKPPPSSLVERLSIVAFFLIGASIGVFITIRAIDDGTPAALAMVAGATVGGFGTWFVFLAGLRLVAVFTTPAKDRQICRDDDG